MMKACSSKPLMSFIKPGISNSTIHAEALWASFVVEHNLAFNASDHATKLFTKMFPDSEIAKSFACGRTKTTCIIKGALAPHYSEQMMESLDKCESFSVLMDESNDKVNKSCIILIKLFDYTVGDVRTRFLDMPIVNIGTAANLFEALKDSLSKKGLDFGKCISFMSDTTNVMKGVRSGVQKRIKDECPQLYDGCICHLADLTIKAGMETLPVNIDQLFVDIFYFFYHSSKRKEQFADNWCSFFPTEPAAILKHCTTRWLSLLRCVDRYISQFEGLKSYFLSCDESETEKVQNIISVLENPFTKPILLFLSHILPSMDKFNRLFQKSKENSTCQLYNEMGRLVRLYASNLLKPDVIKATENKLGSLNLEKRGQLADENLGIGNATWVHLTELEEEHDVKPFYAAVRNWYVATIKKMLKNFPFHDTLLKDLGIINPEVAFTNSYSASTIVSLAKRFPQMGLSDSRSLDKLREEFMDLSLSSSDHPEIAKYKSADGTWRPRSGKFWWEVSKLTTFDGEERFPLLSKLMAGLLSIPVSNADSERGFSMLRKIHTDQRPSLNQDTLIALMTMKFNCSDFSCYESNFSDDVLTKCKKATSLMVKRPETEAGPSELV